MIAVALGLAACGGDDEGSDETATTTAPPEPVAISTEELVAGVAGVTPEEVSCLTSTTTEDDTATTTTDTTTTDTTTTDTTTTDTTTTDTTETTPTETASSTCQADGVEYVVADPGGTVELDTLSAELTEVEATEEVSGDYLDPRPAKNGVFVVGTMTVVNNDFTAQKFDDLADQVLLKVGQATYKEPFNVLNGVLTDSFLWKDEKIQPDSSATGAVAFDITDLAVEEMNTEGNGAVLVLNFGDVGNARGAAQVGLLRVGEVAAPAETESTEETTTTDDAETFTGTTTTETTTTDTTTSETTP